MVETLCFMNSPTNWMMNPGNRMGFPSCRIFPWSLSGFGSLKESITSSWMLWTSTEGRSWDPYGAESPARVLRRGHRESFFEMPIQLQARHPELYQQLRLFYKQDPAILMGHPGQPVPA